MIPTFQNFCNITLPIEYLLKPLTLWVETNSTGKYYSAISWPRHNFTSVYSWTFKIRMFLPRLQHLSMKCRITLNNFCCATVSHSSMPQKSWEKHNFDEVVSLIPPQNLIFKMFLAAQERLQYWCKSIFGFYDMHTLSNNFLWWCEHAFLVDFKECCVLESNLWPHGDHAYLSFPMVWNCGWLWHNKNHSMWFRISLKGAVIWVRISLFWMFNCKHFKNYVLVRKLQNSIFRLNFVSTSILLEELCYRSFEMLESR